MHVEPELAVSAAKACRLETTMYQAEAVHEYLARVRAAQAAWTGTTDQGATYSPATVTYLAAYETAARLLEAHETGEVMPAK